MRFSVLFLACILFLTLSPPILASASSVQGNVQASQPSWFTAEQRSAAAPMLDYDWRVVTRWSRILVEETVLNGSYVQRQTTVPDWAWDGQAWVPYVFADRYSQDGYYEIRSGVVAARLRAYFTVLYDVNVTEQRTIETWIIQRKVGQIWLPLALNLAQPSWSVITNSSGVFLTKTQIIGGVGILRTIFSFREGLPLKHTIIFVNLGLTREFRIVQIEANIPASTVGNEFGEVQSASSGSLVGSLFTFRRQNGEFLFQEDQRNAIGVQVSLALSLNASVQLPVATWTFSNSTIWTLQNGGSLELDPDSSTKSTTTWADDSTVGSVTWSNPTNAQSSNDGYATAGSPNNRFTTVTTHYLKGTSLGFSVSGTINGIVVPAERKCSISSAAGACADNSVRLLQAGSYVGNNNAVAGNWGTTDASVNHGTSTDLWGASWTSTQINAANFGVGFSSGYSCTGSPAACDGATTITASVDFISITVYYTLTGGNVNLKIVMFDGSTALTSATVTMNNGTDYAQTTSSSCNPCWANYTTTTGSVTVKVQWAGSYVNGTFTLTTLTSQTITVKSKVYQNFAVNFRYGDGSTAFTPTRFKVLAPNNTLLTVTTSSSSYTIGRVQNGTWTFKEVYYWSNNVVPDPNPTFAATADSQSTSISARVYLRTAQWKESGGSALYVNPSSYKNTAPNASLSAVLTIGQGYWTQNGTSTVSLAMWEGTDVTPASATWDASSGNPTFNLKVYSLTLAFKDDGGTALSPAITSYSIQFPNGTTFNGRTSTSYSQVQTGTITLTLILWEGTNITPTSNTYSLTASGTWSVNCKVFSLLLLFKDSGGTSLSVGISSYSIQFPNGTTFNGRTSLSYTQVQVGTITLTSIVWEGTDITPASNTYNLTGSGAWSVDCKVYSLKQKQLDNQGQLLTVQVTYTFPNGTSIAKTPTSGWVNMTQVQVGSISISSSISGGTGKQYLLNSASPFTLSSNTVGTVNWIAQYHLVLKAVDGYAPTSVLGTSAASANVTRVGGTTQVKFANSSGLMDFGWYNATEQVYITAKYHGTVVNSTWHLSFYTISSTSVYQWSFKYGVYVSISLTVGLVLGTTTTNPQFNFTSYYFNANASATFTTGTAYVNATTGAIAGSSVTVTLSGVTLHDSGLLRYNVTDGYVWLRTAKNATYTISTTAISPTIPLNWEVNIPQLAGPVAFTNNSTVGSEGIIIAAGFTRFTLINPSTGLAVMTQNNTVYDIPSAVAQSLSYAVTIPSGATQAYKFRVSLYQLDSSANEYELTPAVDSVVALNAKSGLSSGSSTVISVPAGYSFTVDYQEFHPSLNKTDTGADTIYAIIPVRIQGYVEQLIISKVRFNVPWIAPSEKLPKVLGSVNKFSLEIMISPTLDVQPGQYFVQVVFEGTINNAFLSQPVIVVVQIYEGQPTHIAPAFPIEAVSTLAGIGVTVAGLIAKLRKKN